MEFEEMNRRNWLHQEFNLNENLVVSTSAYCFYCLYSHPMRIGRSMQCCLNIFHKGHFDSCPYQTHIAFLYGACVCMVKKRIWRSICMKQLHKNWWLRLCSSLKSNELCKCNDQSIACTLWMQPSKRIKLERAQNMKNENERLMNISEEKMSTTG